MEVGVYAIAGSSTSEAVKKPARDSKRRATHSQIERRRREKINDRLVTLRSIVPACAAEIDERRRVRREEEEDAKQIAAGGAGVARGAKRRRTRRRARQAEEKDDKEDELGLHKLEVLTHTIEYIYELQGRVQSLQGRVSEPHLICTNSLTGDVPSVLPPPEQHPTCLDVEAGRISNMLLTLTNESSDREPSPSIAASKSPFSPFSACSANTSTYVTSPMMSLSSESPLLHCNSKGSVSQMAEGHHCKSSRQSSDNKGIHIDALYTQGAHRSAGKVEGQDDFWQMLPAPLLPVSKRVSDSHRKSQPETSSSCEPATSQCRADARLLLSLKRTSLPRRPTSALRQTSASDWITRRRSASIVKSTGLPACGADKERDSDVRSIVTMSQSAPGGAYPTTLLPSPPLFALDAKICADGKASRTEDGS